MIADVSYATGTIGVGDLEAEVFENALEHPLERAPIDIDTPVQSRLEQAPGLELEHELDQRVYADRAEDPPRDRGKERARELRVGE